MKDSRIAGLVSVIIPIFNAGRFLAEAVESVLAQSYSSWELLLIEDGSIDGSDLVAGGYAERHPDKIQYLQHRNHENRGVCSTRNLGMSASRGEYVAFLDADDVWLPGKLEKQIALMRSYPEADFLYGHSRYFDDEKGQPSGMVPALAESGLYKPPGLLKLNYPLGDAGAPCPSSFLLRYEALEAIGGFEESFNRLQVYEDQVFLAKAYINLRIFVSESCWDKYRVHGDSCTGRSRAEGGEVRARKAYLAWLAAYLRERRVEDSEIWQALRRLEWPYRHPFLAQTKRAIRKAARQILGRT